jgi:hypothetical protein
VLKKIYFCSLIFCSGLVQGAQERPVTPENQPVRHDVVPARPVRPHRNLNPNRLLPPRILFPEHARIVRPVGNDENAITPSNNHRG